MHFILGFATAASSGGVIRISDKSSGINPAANRGFTGEKGVDGDVTTEVTGVDKEQTEDVTTEPEMGVTTSQEFYRNKERIRSCGEASSGSCLFNS